MSPLVLIGAGGHLSVVAEVARLTGHEVRGAIDPAFAPGARPAGVEILGGEDQIAPLWRNGCAFHIALTDPHARHRLRTLLERCPVPCVVLVHPRAVVSAAARIGAGCFIAAGAIVGAGAVLEPGVVLNTGAQVDHDSRIGADSHLAPGAVVAGGVSCGERTFIALGAIVGPNLRIGSDCVIGAGSTVLNDIGDGTFAAGTPARPIRR